MITYNLPTNDYQYDFIICLAMAIYSKCIEPIELKVLLGIYTQDEIKHMLFKRVKDKRASAPNPP